MARFFKLGFKGNIYTLVVSTVIVPILLLQYIGLLQPLELAFYDALFLFKQPEAIDHNIVIVEWDERSIRELSETIISDRTLADTLSKINQQSPRLIGLDLYRDLPVGDFYLSSEENQEAHNLLNKIFLEQHNLIGVEKIIRPTVNPPEALKRKDRVAATDLPADSDFRVRRAYAFPYTDEENEGNGIGIPYIGIVLGYQYLSVEGWDTSNLPYAIRFYRENREFLLKGISSHAYLFGKEGLNFLVNWRNARSRHDFIRVSVVDVVKNQISTDLFEDRLVIIGNTTSYGGDIHNTSIDRWHDCSAAENEENCWTEGVEIVANVSSSIIATAHEGRNLITIAPEWNEILLLIAGLYGLVKIAIRYTTRRNTITRLRCFALVYSLSSIAIFCLISLIAFNLQGLWINIVPASLAIAWGQIVVVYYCYSKKEQRDFEYIRLLIKNFKHNIGSVAAHVASSNRGILRHYDAVKKSLVQDSKMLGIEADEFEATELSCNLNSIKSRTENIHHELDRIKNYQKRTSDFLEYIYSNRVSQWQQVDFNQAVKKAAVECIEEYNLDSLSYVENFDPTIGSLNIRVEYIPIIIENLVSNACYAVKSISSPRIEIGTKNWGAVIEIYVIDNGIGMTEAQRKKILLPFHFFRLGGQGIGLSLVDGILKNIGGTIEIESRLDRGSKFSVKVPKIRPLF